MLKIKVFSRGTQKSLVLSIKGSVNLRSSCIVLQSSTAARFHKTRTDWLEFACRCACESGFQLSPDGASCDGQCLTVYRVIDLAVQSGSKTESCQSICGTWLKVSGVGNGKRCRPGRRCATGLELQSLAANCRVTLWMLIQLLILVSGQCA